VASKDMLYWYLLYLDETSTRYNHFVMLVCGGIVLSLQLVRNCLSSTLGMLKRLLRKAFSSSLQSLV